MTIANVNIKKVLFRRGNTIQNDNYRGVFGEVSVDTEAGTLRVHDGTVAGGTRLATYTELTDIAVGNIDLTGYATTSQITAANTEIAKLRANITAANAAIVSNYNFLLSNAGVAHTEINGLRADITAANVAWTANAATQATAINLLNSNLTAFGSYANATFTGGGGSPSNYSNTNVAAYLTGSITAGNIVPNANVTYTLGNLTHWWKELYVGSNTIFIAGIPLSIDNNNNLLIDGNIVQGGNVDAVNSNVAVIDANIGAYQRWANVNAASQTTSINTTNANIGAYQIWANANAATQTTSINTTNANIGAYQIWANGNAAAQTTSINTINANVAAANTAIATLQTQVYSDANTAAYLAGAVTAGNVTTGNLTVEYNAVVLGNLRVAGTQTTVNASTLNITDLWVTVADGATQASDAHGAGLRVDGALANIAYSSVSDSFEFNKQIVVGNVKFSDTTRFSGNTITLPNTQGFNWYFNDPMIGSDTVTLYMNGLTTGYDSWALTTGNGTNSWMLDSSTQEFSLFNGGVDGGKLVFGTAANAGVRSSIDDIELKSSVGNVFIRANANPWTFSENGNLILPTRMNFASSPAISGTGIIFGDGSYQNTAWTGNVARLTNNGYTVTLGTDGTLTIVNAITTPGGQYFVVTSDTSTEMSWANAVQDPNTDVYSGIGSNSDGTAISVASTDSEGSWVFKTWDFDMSGNLTIPGNINYANGQSILSGITGGGGSTGDLIISGNIITSNDGNTFVNFDSDNELVLGTNTSSNVKIFVDDSNGGNLKTWTFSTDGSLIVPNFGTINFVDPVIGGFGTPNTTTRTPGNRIVLYPSFNGSGLVDYAIGIDGDVQWYSIPDSNARFEWYAGNNKVLSLSGDGILQLPAGGDIVDSTGASVLGSGGGNVSLPGLTTAGTGTSNVAGNQVYALSINTESESDDEIALKVYAGGDNAGPAIAIGQDIGGSHRANVIAIGNFDVGYNSLPGGVYIGYAAGYNNVEQPQGLHSIAIGSKAAYTFATNNSITLNATGNDLTPDESGLFIKPVRAEEYDDAILYYNPTSGEVTYANNTGTSALVTVGNTAQGTEGALWYNTEDGRTYVYALDTWIDASPAVVPGNMVGYDTDGNITLNEDARINYANGVSIINSVYGDSQVASFLDDYTGNIAKIGATPLSIAAASVRLTSDNETWTFAPDGVIALPNGMTIESYGTLGSNATVTIGGDDTRISIDNNGAPPGLYITANATGTAQQWVFGPDGDLAFPDGSTQTTAYTGGGGGTGNALVNGGYTVALQANGVVTIGANATISNDGAEFRLWATDTDITVYRNGQDGYGVKAGNIEVYTDNALRTVVNSNGLEIKTGGISFASSTAIISNVDVITVLDHIRSPAYQFANGVNILSSIPSTGDITFDGSDIIGTGTNVTITADTTDWTFYSNGSTVFPDHGAVSITGNLTVGNLTVTGNSTIINTESYTVVDNIIQMATDNPADTLDLGFVAHRTVDSTLQHTGLVRDSSAGTWRLFSNVTAQPGSTVDFTDAIYDTLAVGGLEAGNTFIYSVNFTGSPLASSSPGIQWHNGFQDGIYGDTQVAAYLSTNTATVANLRVLNTYAPVEATGNVGDLHGQLRIDSNYLYVTSGAYGQQSYTVKAFADHIFGTQYFIALAKGTYPKPENGWEITRDGWGTYFSLDAEPVDFGTYWWCSIAGYAGSVPAWTTGDNVTLRGTTSTVWKSIPLTTFGTAAYGNTQVAAYLLENPQGGSTYSNTNVSAYLDSGIMSNITTTANVIAPNYLFANGVNILSTIGAGSYANADAAAYLAANSAIYLGNPATRYPLQANVTQTFIGNTTTIGAGSNQLGGTYILNNAYFGANGAMYARNTQTGAAQYRVSGGTFDWAGTIGAVTANSVQSFALWAQLNNNGLITYNSTPITSAGLLTASAGLSVASAVGITTTQATFPLVNATATTINFGGAATTLNMGASTGTTRINNALTVTGSATIGGTFTVSSATANLSLVAVTANTITANSATLSGNITVANIITTGTYGNITGANVISANTFIASGNIRITGTGGNIATTYPVYFDATTNQLSRSIMPRVSAYYSTSTQTFNWGDAFKPDAVELNIGSIYDSSTGVFTPTVPGWYKISLVLWTQSSSTGWYAQFSKAGTASASNNSVIVGDITISSTKVMNGSTVLYFNGTTDTAAVYMYAGIFSGSDTVVTRGSGYFDSKLSALTFEWVSP